MNSIIIPLFITIFQSVICQPRYLPNYYVVNRTPNVEQLDSLFPALIEDDNPIRKSFPAPPECTIMDHTITPEKVFVTVYANTDSLSDKLAYIVKKTQYRLKCHENWSGAADKTIESIIDIPFPTDLNQLTSEDKKMIQDLRSGAFQESIPEWECGYWGDYIKEQLIYKATKIVFHYDPSGDGILNPQGLEHCNQSLCLMLNRDLFVKHTLKQWDFCNLSPIITGAGLWINQNLEESQIIMDSTKTAFGLITQRTHKCGNKEYALSKGGYVLHIEKVKDSSKLNTENTNPTNPPPETSTGAQFHHRMRYKSDDEENIETTTEELIVLRDLPRDRRSVSRTLHQMMKSKKPVREISYCEIQHTVAAINNRMVVDLSRDYCDLRRQKRNIPITEMHGYLHHQRQVLSSSEVQWGLWNLANGTYHELLLASQANCNLKRDQYYNMISHFSESEQEYDMTPILHSYFPELNIYSCKKDKNSLLIWGGKDIEVQIVNPLICCEDFCKVYYQSKHYWIQSISGRLFPLDKKTKCDWMPKSHVLKNRGGQWIDIVMGVVVVPSIHMSPITSVDPNKYFFNTSLLNYDYVHNLNESSLIDFDEKTGNPQIIISEDNIFKGWSFSWLKFGGFMKYFYYLLILMVIGFLVFYSISYYVRKSTSKSRVHIEEIPIRIINKN